MSAIGPKVSTNKISAKYMQTIPIVLPHSCVSAIAISLLQGPLCIDKDSKVNHHGHWQPPGYGVITGKHCTHVSTSGSIRRLLVVAYRTEINAYISKPR